MQRKAVVVAGATGNAGFDDPIDDVLARFAFAPAERLPSVARALARAREGRVDLLLVPLESGELDALAADLVPVGATLVVGTSAQLAPDLMLRAMRAGVNEFLTTPVSGDELAAAVQRHLRRSQSDTTGRLTVAVYSPKGGLGTTSVAINLAHHLASRPRANGAALVDFVVGGGDVAVMLNLRPSFDIGDLALKIDQLDAALLDSVLAPGPGNVRVLAASERPETTESVDGQAAVAILAQLRAGSAYTVIDCEHHLSDRTLAAMDAADRMVLVTQLNVAAVRSTQRAISICRRLGFGEDKLVVAANRYQAGDLISVDDAQKVLDHEIVARIPNDYRASEAALTRGIPVSAHAPESPLARAYAELTARLVGETASAAAAAPASAKDRSNSSGRFGRLLSIGRK